MPLVIEDQVGEAISRLNDVANSGFTLALHVRFTAASFLLQSYPEEWIKQYSRLSMMVRDPALRWGMANTGWSRWSDMPGADTNEVMLRAREFGLRYGATYTTKAHRSRTMAFVSRSDREFTDDELRVVQGEVDRLHDLTRDLKTMSPTVAHRLRELSVHFTRR